ncbi:hypothetical protein N7539_002032 [Penicillium diatomitis]|uniref:Uncharacterized protein n=1 Tax=Penicillium diatomitis TaxID=2819901 RepID=A0A9X0C0G1_9EURO|nr:uncharacterized protein N7539_002032 [Penicillium diatomitis]KAJ5493286.1 hypothetical protein N7539_002032 [Penicillium diatomitis]
MLKDRRVANKLEAAEVNCIIHGDLTRTHAGQAKKDPLPQPTEALGLMYREAMFLLSARSWTGYELHRRTNRTTFVLTSDFSDGVRLDRDELSGRLDASNGV